MCGCQGFLGCEISFPSIDSRLKQVSFFRPPEVINFRLKSLLETTFAQSKQICSFDDGDTHTRSIDLVGVESILSAIEVKDSQMKPEIPNACHATPHFWREMQMAPIKRDKSTSRDFVSRGRPLRGQTRLAPLAKRSTSSKSREYRETSELGNKKDKYAHPELLYEPSFESFRTLKL